MHSQKKDFDNGITMDCCYRSASLKLDFIFINSNGQGFSIFRALQFCCFHMWSTCLVLAMSPGNFKLSYDLCRLAKYLTPRVWLLNIK